MKQPQEKQCKTCFYYRQHYTVSDNRYPAVLCGHCGKERGQTPKNE